MDKQVNNVRQSIVFLSQTEQASPEIALSLRVSYSSQVHRFFLSLEIPEEFPWNFLRKGKFLGMRIFGGASPVTTCHHLSVIACHHLPSPVNTFHHLSPPVSTCLHLSPPAITCHHLSSPVITCHQLSSPVTTCHHLSPPVSTHTTI